MAFEQVVAGLGKLLVEAAKLLGQQFDFVPGVFAGDISLIREARHAARQFAKRIGNVAPDSQRDDCRNERHHQHRRRDRTEGASAQVCTDVSQILRHQQVAHRSAVKTHRNQPAEPS